MRTYSYPRWSLPTAIVCVAIGIASFMTAFGSLAQKSERASPITSIDRTPASVIDGAFANFGAPSVDVPIVGRPRAQGPCNDFEFSFLNSTCLKFHMKRVAIHSRVTDEMPAQE
jgi:hypothetical protein